MRYPTLVTVCTAVTFFISSANANNGKPNVTVLIGDEFQFDFTYSFFRTFYRCLCNSATEYCEAFYAKSDDGKVSTNFQTNEIPKHPSKFYNCRIHDLLPEGTIYCLRQTDMQKKKLYNYTTVTAEYPGLSCDLNCIELTGHSEHTVRVRNNGNEGIQQCKVDDDDDNTAIIIGVVVAALVIILVVVIIGCVVWRRRGRLRRKSSLQNGQTSGHVETSGSLLVNEYETENILYGGAQAAVSMLSDRRKSTVTHGESQNNNDGTYSYATEETQATAPMFTDRDKLTGTLAEPQNNNNESYTYAVVGPKKGNTKAQATNVLQSPGASDELVDDQVDPDSAKTTSDGTNVYSHLHQTVRHIDDTYNVL